MDPNPPETTIIKRSAVELAATLPAPALPPPQPAPPDGYLVQIHPPGPNLGRRIVVGQQPLVVGRLPECEVYDPDPLVSRAHARIEPRPDGRFQITDLGSRNGTFVNHRRVGTAALGDGDYVRVGGSIYRFLAGGNVEAGFHEEIHRLAITDPLTGLPNRRALMEFLERELERARRYARPLSVAVFDIDHFKAVNDRLGHVAGDAALRALAAAVRPHVRRDELFARYGGEEFVLVLPETDAGPAWEAGERLRRVVERSPFEHDGRPHGMTVSVGVGTADGGEGATAEGLIRRADERLLEAKAAGRNRVSPAERPK